MEYINFHTHRKTAEGVVTPRSFGIHPWNADKENAGTYEAFKAKYRQQFSDAQIIGECGLDKVCLCDWEVQMRLFRWQTTIADELHKPMVIHCVRAFNELMELRKGHQDWIWVVHGFTGNSQLAGQLYRAGIWVSYGAALTDILRTKVHESLRDNRNPFLLETDESEMEIKEIYIAAARIKNISLDKLADTIKQNYKTLLGQ